MPLKMGEYDIYQTLGPIFSIDYFPSTPYVFFFGHYQGWVGPAAILSSFLFGVLSNQR